MDIYGKLNNETIKKEYASIETDTAKVTINNDSDTLKVDVKKVPGKLIIDEYGKSEIDKIFDGSKDVIIKLPTPESIDALDNKIDQEIGRATNKENELNTKIEDEIRTRGEQDTVLTDNINGLNTKITDLKTSDIQNDGDGNSSFATEEWVSENAGKIDSISVNGKLQSIENKNVNLQVLETSGGTINGDLTVTNNFTVKGTTTTIDTQTLAVKDNTIVTNSGKEDLINLSGLAINKDKTDTYGIMYDPNEDSVKLGLGKLDDNNEFSFNENEGNPVATRDDSSAFMNNHLIKWSEQGKKLVDSGKSIDDIIGGLTVLTDSDFPLNANLSVQPLYKHKLSLNISIGNQSVVGIYHYLSNNNAQITNATSIDDNFTLNIGLVYNADELISFDTTINKSGSNITITGLDKTFTKLTGTLISITDIVTQLI